MSGSLVGRNRSAKGPGARRRPALEGLEQRELLATFTVTNTSDAIPAIPGSLRAAIINSNVTTGTDQIVFNIGGSGVHTITPIAPLPALTDTVVLDGTTQPGYAGQPVIELNGTLAGTSNGLRVDAGSSSILGLTINRFSGNGILIEASAVTVTNCWIGISNGGTTALGNSGAGIFIDGTSNNQIGQANPTAGNVISGNAGDGVNINGSSATNNALFQNVIGLNFAGTQPIPNDDGVTVNGGTFNRIGGENPGEGNLISGNTADGVKISGGSAKSNAVVGNSIGTDAKGTVALGNGDDGVAIVGGGSNAVGGLIDGAGNLISGNKGNGISVSGGPRTMIFGNVIGTDVGGTNPNLGNAGAGVLINGGDNSEVGGTTSGAANVIAFNGTPGLGGTAGGVRVTAAGGVSILSNSIHDNVGSGIDSPNQVAPALTKAATAAGRTLVQGTLSGGAPNAKYQLQFFANPTMDPSGFGEGQTLLNAQPLTVTTDAAGAATINIILPTPTVIGQFVTATATDPNGSTSNFSADQAVTKANLAGLTLELAANPSPATLGGTLTYTLTVTNTGPSTATNVVLVDKLDPSTTFDQANPPSAIFNGPANTVTFNLGNIPAGQTTTATITVTPTATGTVTDSATISSGEIDTDVADNSVSVDTNVNIPIDLDLTTRPETATPNPSVAGQNFAYILTVTNNGPGPATGVTLRDALPAGVTFVSGSAGQGSVTQSGGVVTANLGTLAFGVSASVRIVVLGATPGTVTDNATVQGDEVDRDPSNNASSVTVTILPASDLGVTLDATPSPVRSGANLTYIMTVSNDGPDPASGVIATANLPTTVDFLSAVPTQGGPATLGTGNVLSVPFGTIAAGDTATVTITVIPRASGLITATVGARGNEADINPSNDTVSVTTAVDPTDVGVSILAQPSPAAVGRNLVYTIYVFNNGPATATGVTLTDTLPAGVTLNQVLVPQGVASNSGQTVTVAIGTLLSGASVPVTIVVTPTTSTSLSNSAKVTGDQFDTNPDNNGASTTTPVSPADLVVKLIPSATSTLAGNPLYYVAVVTNVGPSVATHVMLANTLPAGVAYNSAGATQGTVVAANGGVVADLGTLAPGASAVLITQVTPVAAGSLRDTATVVANEVDPNQGNNADTITTAVSNAPGQLQFAAPVIVADENAGTATITVTRTGGNLGAVAVGYMTSDGTGLVGVNYAPAAGVLVFQDGQLSQTFTVPLIDDGLAVADKTVNLTLGGPIGGATLGPQATATLLVRNTDVDLAGPRVVGAISAGAGPNITALVLGFSEALDPNRASDPNNYQLTAPIGVGGVDQVVAILPPAYDPVAHTVTITPVAPLPANAFSRLVVNGGGPTGVSDIFGNGLQGAGNGVNGAPFVEFFGRGSSLSYGDRNGDLVTLGISGGFLDVTRSGDGEGQVLQAFPAGGRPTLTGSVRRNAATGDGITTFQAITGAGFGQVINRLTTPPFYFNGQVPVTTFQAPPPSFANRFFRTARFGRFRRF